MSIFERSEYEGEISLLGGLRRDKIAQEAESRIWTMRNGERISIRDMTDSHLLNTLRLVKRFNEMDMLIPWVTVLEEEVQRRGLNETEERDR